MPLHLRRRGKVWYVRGSVAGRRFPERSTKVGSKDAAEKIRIKWEAEFVKGRTDGIPFADAVTRYVKDGGEARFIDPLLRYFGTTPINKISNAEISRAATILYPDAALATRNRQVFTPMLAILHHAGREITGRRPRVPRKTPRRAPDSEWFSKLLPHCPDNLAAIVLFLSVTGARITEALTADFDLRRMEATMETKTGPRLVSIPVELVAVLANLDDIFGYSHRNQVYKDLRRACKKAGVEYYTTHELGRHYLARSMLKKGYSLKHVQDACGWASARLVMETYGHLERGDYEKIRGEILEDFGQNLGKRGVSD